MPWEAVGHQRERTGAVLPNVAPSNVYTTADGAILIAANQDTVFKRLAVAMGAPELAVDERYATHQARGRNQQQLDELLGEWSIKYDSGELLEILHVAGVPAGRVYRSEDMFADEHYAARGAIVRAHNNRGEEFSMQNVAPRLSDTPGAVRWAGPDLGEHNDDLLSGLGYTVEQIDGLRNDAVI